MKKVVLKYGLMSGLVSAVLMCATLPLAHRIGFGWGMVVGYTTMVAAFLVMFFGVRSYRETVGGGSITFGRALAVGCLISLITCLFYVGMWEVLYFGFMPHFMDDYGAAVIHKMQAAGASAAQIQAKTVEMEQAKRMYQNPLMNAAMTFLEPLPVAVVMSLLSAALLRKRPDAGGREVAEEAV
jgi:hypothetical protein